MKKWLPLLLCLVVLATALIGCGANTPNDEQTPTTGTTTDWTTQGTTIGTTTDTTTGVDTDPTIGDVIPENTTTVGGDDTTQGTTATTQGITTTTDPTDKTTTKAPITTTKKPTTTTTQGNVQHPAGTSIAAARSAAAGSQLTITGVVARITYAFGMKPSGVMLVDQSGSIYVYSSEVASACRVGNTITISGTKAYWILETEVDAAAKFGYKGCNQIDNATLLVNDGKTSGFSTRGIPATTVKEIMDTPVTQDIASKVYKVTALVTKAPGQGFTNYYINDLDGKTGSYVYTQCNGSDFGWLDKYDGKICTVYLTALNAKSSNAGCVWRFLPIEVKDEGFDPASVNVAEHAVKYYGLTQFQSTYSGDPALELITSVDSDLLKFKGAKLTYSSSNTKVATVTGNTLHCLSSGDVQITVTGSYGGKTYSRKFNIKVTITAPDVSYPTVKEAIDAALDTKVTVKGIVGPSLVNKTGFYLIDKTGVIAVETTADVMDTLEIGHEVVLEATRGFNSKDGAAYGQTCLKDATVKLNNYGNHAYPTTAFKGDISVADFYNLPVTTDYTTCVYTMKATVTVEETNYYTNIFLTDGTTNVRLYCSSASQYNWLKEFAGQEVTVEIAACNWNSKNYYTGCVLSVIKADGTKVYNNLNFL